MLPSVSSDHHRRSIRLKGYDYSTAGVYFVTVCVQDRACLLGDLVEEQLRLNNAGQTVQEVWDGLSRHYQGVSTDAVVVMPNHLHGIIALEDTGGLSLADVVHRFKTMTTMRYIRGVKDLGWPGFRGRLWQRNYFEHVIRDEESLNRIRQYITDNPINWAMDEENPSRPWRAGS